MNPQASNKWAKTNKNGKQGYSWRPDCDNITFKTDEEEKEKQLCQDMTKGGEARKLDKNKDKAVFDTTINIATMTTTPSQQ